MTAPLQLISTDFDGTIYVEDAVPPVATSLQAALAELQDRGAHWVINTGRDLDSLQAGLAHAAMRVQPDYLVLVERFIYARTVDADYASVEPWNSRCRRDHEDLFRRVRPAVPGLAAWIQSRFDARVYEDAWSPFCLVAATNAEADAIQAHVDAFCRTVPDLTLVRNDVYARFSHAAYDKGSALAEIGRRLGVPPERTFAAGDHLNDLPMLARARAAWLVAPRNAIPPVRDAVARAGGLLAELPHGDGVAWGLRTALVAAAGPGHAG